MSRAGSRPDKRKGSREKAGSGNRHFYHGLLDTMRHWEKKVYGYSVGTHEPKGIVVVGLERPRIANEETAEAEVSK